MATEYTPVNIDIPNFGSVPVQVNHDRDGISRGTITHRSPTVSTVPYLEYLSKDVIPVNDPASRTRQYAVRRQKLVTLPKTLLDQLQGKVSGKKLSVGIVSGQDEDIKREHELRSINENPLSRIIGFDCPDAANTDEVTVLLDWSENTAVDFPDVLLFDPVTKKVVTRLPKQTNNFLLSSGDPNTPPPHPPWATVEPLNSQPSDFRTATDVDIQQYQPLNGHPKRPAVAVLDTGLKYNICNLGEEDQCPDGPYAYRDADNRKRRFTLAYQDPSETDCEAIPADNVLGYCALQAYRQADFRAGIKPPRQNEYTSAEVVNSPFDDCRLFSDATSTTIVDARHGTSITALIQQNGDDAPVLPVKAFDNMGFTTLFDVLNGFNYILHRQESANIRVVNVSWICTLDEPMLKEKIRQLMEAGVFVVAASGNEQQTGDRNLDVVPVYPACYSQEFPNVITVTSVRKTYFAPDLISRRGDSIIGNLLGHAIKDLGLFGLLEGADDVVGAILPTAGYVAVENYSTTYVNVGVVSTFGYFRSPFWTGKPIRGSSFACALVSGFVIRQLSTRPDGLPSGNPVSRNDMARARQELLDAMSGTDQNLMTDYVAGGYYLAGYDID